MIRRTVLLLGIVVMFATVTVVVFPKPAAAHNINNIRLASQDTGKCLGFQGSTAVIKNCDNSTSQSFDVVDVGGGYHQLKPKHQTNKCLEVLAGFTNDGAAVVYSTCNSSLDHQKFTIASATLSWSTIKPRHTELLGLNKCLDVYGGGVGSGYQIVLWPCNGGRNQQWTPDNHDAGSIGGVFDKTLWIDRWNQFYEDNPSSWCAGATSWMTLCTHRHVGLGYQPTWNGPITSARDDWNSGGISTNTVFLSEVSAGAAASVHVGVTTGCFTDATIGVVTCSNDSLGKTYIFDELKHPCELAGEGDCDGDHSRPHTWWYAAVVLDVDEHEQPPYNTYTQRQGTTAHEFGHVFSLSHDGAGEGFGDGKCGHGGVSPANGPVPRTIMDYDCLEIGWYRPEPWDSCGINHAYYDPAWGFAGC